MPTQIKITPSMSIDTVQAYLNKKGTIIFTPGKYNITKILTVYSNTTLILTGATLIRKNPSHIIRGYVDPNVSYNYNAVENITVKDGTFIGDGIKKNGSIIGFIHGNNIIFENSKIQNTYQSHAFDIGACKDVTLKGIDFSGRIIDPDGSFREEIQYDFAYAKGFPYFPVNSKVYNGNHCEHIIIDSCKFKDSNFCIGTHTETTSTRKHKNFQIINCEATGKVDQFAGSFLKLINIDGAEVKNNTIQEFSKGIMVTSCGKLYNNNGTIVTQTPATKTGNTNITITGNKILNAKDDSASAGITVGSPLDGIIHSNITIENNIFNLNNINAKNDIDIKDTHKAKIHNNKTKLNILVEAKTTLDITLS